MIRSLKKVDLARVLLNDLNSLNLWPLVRVDKESEKIRQPVYCITKHNFITHDQIIPHKRRCSRFGRFNRLSRSV